MRRSLVNLTALLALLAIPATATAQQAPPPTSELDQYIPTYPDAKGDKELGGGDRGGGGGGGGGGEGGDDGTGGGGTDAVPPETDAELRSSGPSGEAAAEFAQGTPSGDGQSEETRPRGDGGDGGSVLAAIARALVGDSTRASSGDSAGDSSGGGMGVLLPLLLAVIAVGGVLYVLRRRGILGSSGGE